eukprot:COSAG02_NODE_2828_length_7940_cov_6.526081_5_plen_272_part_00
MSDEPNVQSAREPTLTSLLASIVRENRPGRTVRLVDPVRTHGHNELKRAYIYALLDSRGAMRVIGSTRSSLSVRLSCYRSSLRNPHHTTSPLLRYMQRTEDTFDNWQIIALKTLWYDPMHCEDRIRDEERASINYYRSIGTPLLNHNNPIDTNDRRRTCMEEDCGHTLSHLVFTLAPFLLLATESTLHILCTSYTACIVRLLCKRTDTLSNYDYDFSWVRIESSADQNSANFMSNLPEKRSDSRWSEGITVFISEDSVLQTIPTQPVRPSL